ncbi:MAG: SDR family oxidoreductase [Actinomycetota bacterium]
MSQRDQGCALVTGGERGIGGAITERLRADGWTVATLGRSGGDVIADIGDRQAVKVAFDEVQERYGPVLVLVNNAGQRLDSLAIRMPDADWDAVLETNLTGAFTATKLALSSMLKARWGRIVNISSVVAEHANPGQANYAASKAGLLALTRTVAKEMAKKGITCNAVTPGLITTEMTTDVAQALMPMIPAARAGTPAEVAACVAFLCSDEAAYVNGATIAVDGGMAA